MTKEEFRAVLDSISEQAEHGKRKYPMHYVCGVCGKRLARLNRVTIHCHREYMYSKSSCEGVRLRWKDADAEVLKLLKEKLRRILKEEEMVLQKKKEAVPAADQIKAAEIKLDAVNKEKKKLFDRLADRQISREDFKAKRTELDEQISELEQRVSDLKAAGEFADDGSRAEEIRSFLDIPEMTEAVWNRFVECVVVYPDKRLEVHWSFEEEI